MIATATPRRVSSVRPSVRNPIARSAKYEDTCETGANAWKRSARSWRRVALNLARAVERYQGRGSLDTIIGRDRLRNPDRV